jgi:hypothetical protein
MSKRFVDTNRWKSFRGLSSKLVRLYDYCWDKSDACGVYEIDFEYLKIDTGENYKDEDFLKLPKDLVAKISPGKILFIKFIEVNYGELKDGYNPHKPAFRALEKNKLEINSSLNQALFKLEEEDKEEGEEEKGKRGVGKKPKEDKLHLFKDSEFYNLEKFESEFKGTEWERCDLRSYYQSVKDWSASGGNKKVDWIATARNFMAKDKRDGKLIIKKVVSTVNKPVEKQLTESEKKQEYEKVMVELLEDNYKIFLEGGEVRDVTGGLAGFLTEKGKMNGSLEGVFQKIKDHGLTVKKYLYG